MTGPNDYTMDITEYLTARLDESEQTLQSIVSRRSAYGDGDYGALDGGWYTRGPYGRLVREAFKPELMLAEVQAKRLRIALHGFTPAPDLWRPLPKELPEGYAGDFVGWCDLCSFPSFSYEPWPCMSLRLEAAPYIDRADFELAWRV